MKHFVSIPQGSSRVGKCFARKHLPAPLSYDQREMSYNGIVLAP